MQWIIYLLYLYLPNRHIQIQYIDVFINCNIILLSPPQKILPLGEFLWPFPLPRPRRINREHGCCHLSSPTTRTRRQNKQSWEECFTSEETSWLLLPPFERSPFSTSLLPNTLLSAPCSSDQVGKQEDFSPVKHNFQATSTTRFSCWILHRQRYEAKTS